MGAWQRCHQMAAGLGLPPGVDDRAAALANHIIVPGPGLGVDRLTHGAQHLEIGEVVFLNKFGALAHQGPDRGWRGVELVDLVFFAHGPEPARIRVGGHAFEHHRGGAIGQGAIDDIAVAGDPAHIRRAPVDIAFVVIKRGLMGQRRINQIAAGGVDHALGLAGGAGGIQDEQRIFGAHLGGFVVIRGFQHHFVIIKIAPVDPGGLPAGAFDDQAFHIVLAVQKRGIGVGFQRRFAAAAGGFVGGDDQLGVRAIDPRRQRIRREAGKHDRMDRTNPRTGQHRIGGFGDHRQIQYHALAFAHAQRFQHIGHAADVAVQLFVGDMFGGLIWIICFPDDRGLIAAGFQVAIDAVGGHIQRAIGEPVDRHIARRKADVFDLGKGFDPVHPRGLLGPERVRICDRSGIKRVIFGRIHMGLGHSFWRGGKCGSRCWCHLVSSLTMIRALFWGVDHCLTSLKTLSG